MSERAQALANRIEANVSNLTATIEGCTDAQWRARCAGETWSVGVTAHHVAGGHLGGGTPFIRLVADGQPTPPFTAEMLEQGNAQHAREHADCTRAETLALLKQQGAAAVAMVRGLSDAQLARSATVALLNGATVTAEQLVEAVLIQSLQAHVDSIRAAIA